MHARAAYIRSLGTTSILVAASLLMLGVVGALVGFHGWPEGAVGRAVPSVPLAPAPQPVLSAVRAVRKAPAHDRGAASARARAAASTAGLVKVVPVTSPAPVGYPVALAPGHAAPTSGAPAAPPAATAAPGDPAPAAPAAPSPPATPPTDTTPLQTLLSQLLGSSPPPPAAPAQPESGDLTVPVLGVTVSVPPKRAR